MQFTVEGAVVPKQSFRFSKFGNYQPKKVTDYKKLVAFCFKKEFRNFTPFDDALRLYITIYRKVPTSWSKKKQNEAIEGAILPTSRPDLDNCTKNILDALNGLLYTDDARITFLCVRKAYGKDEKVVIAFTEDK